MIYTIESDNNVTTFASAKEAKTAMTGDYEQFASANELAKLAGNWPATRARFGNGIIRNAGTLTPLAGNQYGIEFNGVNGVIFENIDVYGSSTYPTGANARGVSGYAPYNAASAPLARVVLSNIRVIGAGTYSTYDGFNLNANLIEISNCVAQFIPSYGFYVTGALNVIAQGLTAYNTSTQNSLHRAIWFENNNGNGTVGPGSVLASGLKVLDTQSTATGYIVGGYTGGSGSTGQVGVIDGVIGHIISPNVITKVAYTGFTVSTPIVN